MYFQAFLFQNKFPFRGARVKVFITFLSKNKLNGLLLAKIKPKHEYLFSEHLSKSKRMYSRNLNFQDISWTCKNLFLITFKQTWKFATTYRISHVRVSLIWRVRWQSRPDTSPKLPNIESSLQKFSLLSFNNHLVHLNIML